MTFLHRALKGGGTQEQASQPATSERSGYSLAQLGLLAWGGGWRPGQPVDVMQALRNGASRRCILVLAGAVGRTDLGAYRSVAGRLVELPSPPALIARPSAVLRARQWRRFVAFSMLTDGNAFGLVRQASALGYPTQIELVDPTTVRQREVVGGVKQVVIDGTTHRLFPFGDLWHVPGEVVGSNGFGSSPLRDASMAIGTSLSAEEFGARFFSDGGVPSAILAPETDPGEAGARAIKAAFVRAVQGSREPVVLPQSVRYERIAVAPGDSQFIELARFEVENACRFWGVPPGMAFGAIGGSSITYGNVVDADLQFLKHSVEWLFGAIEEELHEALPRPQTVAFDRDSLLKGDPMRTTQMLSVRLGDGAISRNEYRVALGYEPVADPAFDVPGTSGAPLSPGGGSANDTAGGADDV